MRQRGLAGTEERMRRTLAHINGHLAQPLTIEELSGVAAFSKYHFHRQFSAWAGMTVHHYVQLARLRLAAHRLAYRGHIPVTSIAFDCGYGSLEAFTRMFRRHMGQSPLDFRAEPDWSRYEAVTRAIERAKAGQSGHRHTCHDVTLVHFPETRLAVLDHQGPARQIGETIRRFIGWRKRCGGMQASAPIFNMLFADPAGEAETFRMGIGVATRWRVEPNTDGVLASTIPGGRCARVRLRGSDAELGPAVAFLYGEWLPRSGAETRDFPLFAERHAMFPDVPEDEAATDLYLPLI